MSTDPTPAPASTPREELDAAYGEVLDALELLEERTSGRAGAEAQVAGAQQQLATAQALELQARSEAQQAAEHLKQTLDRLTVVPAAGLT